MSPDALGFVPRLGQIQEGKVKRPSGELGQALQSHRVLSLSQLFGGDILKTAPPVDRESATSMDLRASSTGPRHLRPLQSLSRSTHQSTVSAESHSTVTPKVE